MMWYQASARDVCGRCNDIVGFLVGVTGTVTWRWRGGKGKADSELELLIFVFVTVGYV